MRASMTCLCKSVGRGGRWQSLSLNCAPSIQTNQPKKPSATGITRSRRATASELRRSGPVLRSLAESTRRFGDLRTWQIKCGRILLARPTRGPTNREAGSRLGNPPEWPPVSRLMKKCRVRGFSSHEAGAQLVGIGRRVPLLADIIGLMKSVPVRCGNQRAARLPCVRGPRRQGRR